MANIKDRNATVGFPSSEYISFHDGSKITLEPGYQFDSFELVDLLGRGGMGEVWKVRDLDADRLVAIKFVPRDIQRFDEEMERVDETFRKIHALQDRHICPLYLLKKNEHLGTYLVMKFIDGISLAQYRRKFETFPMEKVLETLKPVAGALDSAHHQGVIHRDIKPSNILIVVDPENDKEVADVQLIDFGLAAEIRRSMTRVSQGEVNVSGTRPYMAPEQWRGRKQDAATDQYALAVVAYELIAGHLPFDADDTKILRECVLNDEPEMIEDVPECVNAALTRGLAKERQQRFACCKDLVAAMTGEIQEVSKTSEQPIILSKIQRALSRLYKSIVKHPFKEVILGALIGSVIGLFFLRFNGINGWLFGLVIGAFTGFCVERGSHKPKPIDLNPEQSALDAELVNSTTKAVVSRKEEQYEKVHWLSLLVVIPCMFVGTGLGAAAGGAIGVGIGLLTNMPEVFAPMGVGVGMIAAWGAAWKLVKKIKF